jgi:AcrR family transcriptional regulator
MVQVESSVPAGSGLRERNIAARRNAILAAARRLLADGGLQALSMRKLADEASLSVRTLYNLWGTREEILEALLLDAQERIDTAILGATLPDDPLEQCEALSRIVLSQMIQDQQVFRAMALARLEGEIAGHRSSSPAMSDSVRQLTEAIKVAREQGIVESPLKPAQIALQVHQGFEMAIIQWALNGIDDAQFEARALYGLNLALLAVVRPRHRARLEESLTALERRLGTLRKRPR